MCEFYLRDSGVTAKYDHMTRNNDRATVYGVVQCGQNQKQEYWLESCSNQIILKSYKNVGHNVFME